MRKIKLILTLTAIALLILLLSSCGTTSAKGLYRKIDRAMSRLDSYKVSSTLDATFYYHGEKNELSRTGTQIYSSTSKKDCYVYLQSSSTSTIDGSDPNYIENVIAYNGGNAFLYSKSDDVEQRLYSPMTRKDFLSYYSASLKSEKEALFDCETIAFEEIESGGWEITFSGFQQDTTDKYINGLGIRTPFLDDEVLDLELTIQASSDFHITGTSMTVVFSENSKRDTSTIELIDHYSDHNEAELITDDLKLEDYRKIYDVRLVGQLEDMIVDMSGEIKEFAIHTTLDYGGKSYSNRSIVQYGCQEGDYYYETEYDRNNFKHFTSYTEGYKRTYVNQHPKTTLSQSHTEARAYITSLINTANYAPTNVRNIKMLEDGRYQVNHVVTDRSQLEGYLPSYNDVYVGATQVVFFTIEEQEIQKIESTIEVTYLSGGIKGERCTLTVTKVVDFNEEVDFLISFLPYPEYHKS